MGATVYLVRHGETHWNRERRYQGWTDIGLNERGWLQAAALARRLRPLRLAAVYASGLRRAVETARAIAEPRRLQVQTMACFREMRFGDWEGLTAEEIQERFGAATYALWLQDPSRVTIPGGETLGELQQRTARGLEALLAAHRQQEILVVTHGGNIMALGCYLDGRPLADFWRYYLDNGQVAVVREQGGQRRLQVVSADQLAGPGGP